MPVEYRRALAEMAKHQAADEHRPRGARDRHQGGEGLGDTVIPGLVPGIQPSTGSGASGQMDTGDKPRYDRARMGKITGFMEFDRHDRGYRPVDERVKHWHEFVEPLPEEEVKKQAARCMDCGIPYCHNGCPVNNQIPDWNDLVYRDQWKTAALNLHSTNNFPEVTGRVCPAPCEASCTLNIDDKPVTIKTIECAIADKAFAEGWIAPRAAREQDRQEDRHRRLGPGGPRRRPAARARRPRGARLREERQARRAAGLRHPRLQDGEAHRRAAREADGGGRRRLPLQRARRQGRRREPSWRPRTTRCCWPAAPSSRSTSSPSRRGATSTASTTP